MKTKFDHISDDTIQDRILKMQVNGLESGSFYDGLRDDADRIATVAACMNRWQCWFGPPVTYYEDSSLEFDGQHRTRACKFLARVYGTQIQIPLRYSSAYLKEEAEVKQMLHEKENRDLCDKPASDVHVGDTLCQ